MLTLKKAKKNLTDYMEYSERDHFLCEFEDGDEAYENAMSNRPHAYVLSLIIKFDGDKKKLHKTLMKDFDEADLELTPNTLKLFKE